MLTLERKNYIIKLLEKDNAVSVAKLSREFDVSEVTVRKMLNEMDRQGYLHRTRGGAVSLGLVLRESGEKEKEEQNKEEKEAIAKLAYEMILDYTCIFLDAGSTTLELAYLIRDGNKRNITVATNALNIAMTLIDSYDIELVFIGGSVRHKIISCVGGLAEDAIASMCFDCLFMGTNSLTLEDGITTPNLSEAHMKRQMLRSTKKAVLICDHTKFGKTSMSRIAKTSQFNTIISDWKLPKDVYEKFIQAEINLLLAQAPLE